MSIVLQIINKLKTSNLLPFYISGDYIKASNKKKKNIKNIYNDNSNYIQIGCSMGM